MRRAQESLRAVENRVHLFLVRYSILFLRFSVGLIFFAFGILKYFPGVSPAQGITEATTHILFFGLIPDRLALVGTATLECAIGLSLMTGRALRLTVYLLIIELLGILSPVVLETGRLFAGPHNAHTLEGQYVLKDTTLVAAAMVVMAGRVRGGRLVRTVAIPETHVGVVPATTTPGRVPTQQQIEAVVAGLTGTQPVEEICVDFDITTETYQQWCNQVVTTTTTALLPDDRDHEPVQPRHAATAS